ncbi:hypothetical protein [Lacrimispora sp.]|uniref:hypothetical protein n=1 Tax=Lacrimispora sp. TaxID=2719234 RepID=UPI00346069C4
MRKLLIVILGLYMVYSNVTMLLGVPVALWKLEQYLLVLVTIAFAALSVKFAILYYQTDLKKSGKNSKKED